MPWSNFHSHTNFSDGSDVPEAYAREAAAQGLEAYGFSCHAPVPWDLPWCLKMDRLDAYTGEITRLKQLYYNKLTILCALEVDYIPGIISPADRQFTGGPFDYTIGSVHFVDFFSNGLPWDIDGKPEMFEKGLAEIWHNDVKSFVQRYFQLLREMLTQARPRIIGHMDKVRMHNARNHYFSEDEPWYRKEVNHTLEAARASGSIVEINTRGMYRSGFAEPYPSFWILKQMLDMQVPVTLNSDAHKPHEITGKFSEMAGILVSLGYKNMHTLRNGEWQSVPFGEKGYIR